MIKGRPDNNGCGCLFVLIVVIGFIVNQCNSSNSKINSNETRTESKSGQFSSRSHEIYEQEELSDEDKQYLGNSLATGTTPYKSAYGKNYKCPYTQCSGIKVTAPGESDIVVIIKKNNFNGKVVAHGYIKAGETFQFDIPDGTYQTFFYYGEGWNPNKVMKGGVRGGFVKDEIFSKDNPQEIYSGILTYVLQLQRDGNFHTKGSSQDEIF